MESFTILEDPTLSRPSPHTNELVDRLLSIHPSPAEMTTGRRPDDAAPRSVAGQSTDESIADSEVVNERTRLLRSKARSKSRSSSLRRAKWYKRPHAMWILPSIGLSALLYGASLSVLIEVLGQVVCREFPPESLPQLPVIHPLPGPVTPSKSFVSSTHRTELSWTSEFVSTYKIDPATLPSTLPTGPYRYFFGFRIARPVDEDWAARCRKSEEVAKATTAFMTTLGIITGLLGVVFSGYWGAISDQFGRVPLLAMTTFAELVDAFGMILLITFPEYLGLRCAAFLHIFGCILGGQKLGFTMTSAYLADLAAAKGESRTKALSDGQAIIMAGIALGPVVGALMVQISGLLLAPFYVTFVFQALRLVLFTFIVPESLPESQRREQRRKAKEERIETLGQLQAQEIEWRNKGLNVALMRTIRFGKRPLAVLAPLKVLLPKTYDESTSEEERPLLATTVKTGDKDWRLTILSLSFAILMITPGVALVKIVFAHNKFDWGPVEIGEWISYSAVTRNMALFVIVPMLVKLLRRPIPLPSLPRPVQVTSNPEGSDWDPKLIAAQEAWQTEAARLKLLDDSKFDRRLALWSILFAFLGNMLMSIPHHNSWFFIVGSGLVGFAAPAVPALQGLALALASPSEAGKVLASLSVLESVATELFGTAAFGSLYILVLDWYTEAVFLVAGAAVLLSAVALMKVKLGSTSMQLEEDRCDEQ